MLWQLGNQAKIAAQKFGVIGQISHWPDGKNLRAVFAHRLLDAGVDERGFTAKITADEQDDIGGFNPCDCGIEIDRAERGHIIGKACLPPFKHRTTKCSREFTRSEHGFTVNLITRKHRN